MSHFSEYEHPEYSDKVEKWRYAWDHYTGTYGDLKLMGGRITDFLEQKYQRENNKAFEERQRVSDVVLHFATVIDGINGVMGSKDDKTNREWGQLGDPEEKGTTAYHLTHNADLIGTNWTPLIKQAGIKLTAMHTVWGLVEGVTDTEEAHIQVINPQHVVNWYPSYGDLEQVLVKEKRDTRESIFSPQEEQPDVYTLFTLDGWRRFMVNDEGAEVEMGSGEYQYYKSERRRKRILPIFRTSIPMPRDVGYLLAKKENHLYNAKSVRDFAVRNMSFAILKLGVDNDEELTELLQKLEKGYNIIGQYPDRPDHEFLTPSSDYLREYAEILDKDTNDFYVNAFKKYAEAASQVTATEVRLESQSGIEAFLSLLVTSVDEFENQCLHRLEQVYFPDNPSVWGEANVERTSDFQPEDMPNISELAKASTELERSRSGSLKTRVELLHPDWTEEEIEEEIQRINQENGMPVNGAELG